MGKTKVRNKSDVINEAGKECRKVHFASLMDICHLKNAELGTKQQKSKVVLRGDIVKDDSGSYAIFAEQGSSASQIMISYPDCQGAQDKQQTQYLLILRSKRKMLQFFLKKNSQNGMSRHLDSSTTTQMA